MNIMIPKNDATELAAGAEFDDYEVVLNEQIGQHRWASEHELVIKLKSTGKFYRAYYQQGLTELPEDHEMFAYQDPVLFRECVPRKVETIVYDAVK